MLKHLILLFCFFVHLGLAAQPTPKKLLIIGCGRSGTAYMTEVLKAAGLNVGHERQVRGDGIVSHLMAADLDHAPWGPLARDYTFEHTFHQVRDPVKVIQSYYNSPPLVKWKWINESVPQVKLTDTRLMKCAKYWIHWNKMAERKAQWTYRIEDFDTQCQEMGRRLGITLNPEILAGISKTTNTRRSPSARVITWEILKKELNPPTYKQLCNLAKRYGYQVPQ